MTDKRPKTNKKIFIVLCPFGPFYPFCPFFLLLLGGINVRVRRRLRFFRLGSLAQFAHSLIHALVVLGGAAPGARQDDYCDGTNDEPTKSPHGSSGPIHSFHSRTPYLWRLSRTPGHTVKLLTAAHPFVQIDPHIR